jgi:hypothetical protein
MVQGLWERLSKQNQRRFARSDDAKYGTIGFRMRLKLLFDMNLPPSFTAYFSQHGVSAAHWATVTPPN